MDAPQESNDEDFVRTFAEIFDHIKSAQELEQSVVLAIDLTSSPVKEPPRKVCITGK